MKNRDRAMGILQSESALMEVVQLVGKDAISPDDRLTLEVARMIREDFLQQNAFMEVDWYSTYDRQRWMLAMILEYDRLSREAIGAGSSVEALLSIGAREGLGRAKSIPEDEYAAAYERLAEEMRSQIKAIKDGGGEKG